MRRVVGPLLAALMITPLLPATQVMAAATADRAFSLENHGFGDLLVDPVHDAVLVSTGPQGTKVFVRDHDGDPIATVTGLAGPSKMALSADGSMLYVVLATTTAVAAVSTSTWTTVAQHAMPPGSCLNDLVAVGTRLWVGGGCTSEPATLGSIDLTAPDFAAAAFTPTTLPAAVSLAGTPALSPSPISPSLVVMSASGAAAPHLYLLDLTTDSPTLVNYRNPDHQRLDPVADLTFSPDGSLLVSVTGNLFAASTLAASGAYAAASTSRSEATAISPDNSRIARGGESYGVDFFTRGGVVARSVGIGPGMNAYLHLPRGSVAFSSTGDWAYLVNSEGRDLPVTLVVVREPAKSVPTLTVSPNSTVKLDATAVLKGTLSNVGAPAGDITVHRTSDFGPVLDSLVPVNADGTWSLSQVLTQRGLYRYYVSWPGNAEYTGVEGYTAVTVNGLRPTLTLHSNMPSTGWVYGQTVTLTTHLGPTHTQRKVRVIRAYKTEPDNEILVGSAGVNAAGDYIAKSTATFIGFYKAYFDGDDRYTPASVYLSMENVRTALYSRVYYYYSTSSGYQLYHLNVVPVMGAAPAPWITGCLIDFYIERWSSTYGWLPYGELYNQHPGSDGAAFVRMSLPRKVGDRFRIHAQSHNNGYFKNSSSAVYYLRITT
ncbi:MAG: hypothetical protein QOE64_2118 [Frankiales bacterium]|jgi:hypothetical protein|nr:hypothetical protein [Frankiales bacterium]